VCRAESGAVDFPSRAACQYSSAARLQPAGPAFGRGLLWGWLPIPLALTGRLARLRERLQHHPTTTDDDPSLLWAAVALILVPDPEAILLIRRAERVGDPWSGHMALPGGRRESIDVGLLDTAMRETAEEVGIKLDQQHLAGSLTDVVPRTPVLPPIAVRPFVFTLNSRPPLRLNAEATSAHWVSLSHLLRPDTRHPVRLDVAGQSRVVPAYELEDGMVWGMTERILTCLLKYCQD
jgi:8-oxo-dGTP pyrophosphatase MutT (NUDIX family)